jgi:hypothetical protein
MTGKLTYGISGCDVTMFPSFSPVMVKFCQNPIQQDIVDSFVPNEPAKPQKIYATCQLRGRSCETGSIDVDIADIPWDTAWQRNSSPEELWLCWEF